MGASAYQEIPNSPNRLNHGGHIQECNDVKTVTLYTDGACEGNPGPGGWAAILIHQQHTREISGGMPATTNNRMELQAAVEGLRALKETCEVEFFTDSQYVRNGISEWIAAWKARGWRTRGKQPVKNEDLWRQLDAESARHHTTWKWLKGHAGHPLNERCDLLARTEILKIRKQFNPDQLKTFLEQFKRDLEPVDLSGELRLD
jgi:ribonuclease HI